MIRCIYLLALSLLLVACASYEGLYEPACIAYEGDTIELRAGRFEWRRFTDQRSIDAQGNVVEPFPDFPKTGNYTLESGRLSFVTDGGDKLDDWFLIERDRHYFLLTGVQHLAYLEAATLPQCALKRVATQS